MNGYVPFFLFIAVAWISLPTANGQRIPGFLKKKIEKHAERAADKAIAGAIDRYIEKKLDELFGLDQKNVEMRGDTLIVRDSLEGTETVLLSEEPPANPEPSSFVGSFLVQAESYKKGKMEKGFPIQMRYHIDKYAIAVEMQGEEQATLIIDRKKRTMTTKMDNDGEKMAIVMPLKSYTVQTGSVPNYEVRETGNTKEIDGHRCREYIVESEKEVSHVWVTDAYQVEFGTFMGFLQMRGQNNEAIKDWQQLEGTPVRTETEVKGKDTRHVSTLSEFREGKVDSAPFSLKGYEVQEMSSLFANRMAEGSGE